MEITNGYLQQFIQQLQKYKEQRDIYLVEKS